MSKKYLVILLAICWAMIESVSGQELKTPAKTEDLPVKLTISTEKNICVGDKFTVVSRLENTGKQEVIIEIRKIKRILTEDSYGEDQPELVIIPKERFGIWPTFDSDSPPDDFRVTLKPGEFYELKYVIDTNKDEFYKSNGTYTLQIYDWQPDKEELEGTSLFFGKVYSNKLEFEIKDCS